MPAISCIFARMNSGDNLIVELTFRFATEIVIFAEDLFGQKKYILANQLFRSGTSIGANVREAQSPESRNDFIHKMKVAHKEAEETKYWLDLCKGCKSYPDPETFPVSSSQF